MINNIWGKRGRVKTYANGSTSPLYMISDYTSYISYSEPQVQDGRADKKHAKVFEQNIPGGEEFDVDKALKNEKVLSHIHELIEAAKESEDKNMRFRARVYDYSTFLYKNPRQFSQASQIPYRVCREAKNQFRDHINKNIDDLLSGSSL